EEAAWTLGGGRLRTFWRVTFPAVRRGVLYALVLAVARALGEFGAVLVVSGNVAGVTQTATLYIYQATVDNDMTSAAAVSLALAGVSLCILLLLEWVRAGIRFSHTSAEVDGRTGR
ncbi:MAG: ABC transporter permease subunit, partial [Alicyclobacillaceae bacterium]|nr:ABC transporter permease subunit [Alicyclobacillaceae bacterium]